MKMDIQKSAERAFTGSKSQPSEASQKEAIAKAMHKALLEALRAQMQDMSDHPFILLDKTNVDDK